MQSIFIVFGKSVSGRSWDLVPYFWAMHTAFLPTLAYLSFLGVGWLAKAIPYPARSFFGVGRVLDNPLKLTAGSSTLLATIFATFAYGAGVLEAFLENATQVPSRRP